MNVGSDNRIRWALLTNKWYYYQDDLINLGSDPFPARLQSGYDRFSDMLTD